jgi:hypothetical protein
MSGSAVSKLRLTHLVSGMPDDKGVFAPGSLRLMANFMFGLHGNRSLSTVGTDDKGALYTYDADLLPVRPIQAPPNEPLVLQPIPGEVVRRSFVIFEKTWQKELLAHLSQAPGHCLQTVPLVFTAEQLEPPPANDEAAERLRRELAARGTLSGQLIPRLKILILLIEVPALAQPPRKIEAQTGNRKIPLTRVEPPVELELRPGLKVAYHAYSSADPALTQGRYVVSLSPGMVSPRFRRGPLSRSLDVAFGIRDISADYDFHVFEFPSVESVVLTHFGELFPHILAPEDSYRKDAKKTAAASPTYAAAATQTARARAMKMVADLKPKFTVGYKTVEAIAGLPDLFKKSLKDIAEREEPPSRPGQYVLATGHTVGKNASTIRSLAKMALGKDAKEGWHGLASLAVEAWAAHDEAKKLIGKWKKMQLLLANLHTIQLAQKVMSPGGVKGLLVATKYSNLAFKLLEEHGGGKASAFSHYVLSVRKDADPAVVKRLLERAADPTLKELQATWETKIWNAGRWALDTSASVRQLVRTTVELMNLTAEEKHAHATFLTNLDEYQELFRRKLPFLQT